MIFFEIRVSWVWVDRFGGDDGGGGIFVALCGGGVTIFCVGQILASDDFLVLVYEDEYGKKARI